MDSNSQLASRAYNRMQNVSGIGINNYQNQQFQVDPNNFKSPLAATPAVIVVREMPSVLGTDYNTRL
jgi:hypothetical protein